MTLIELILSYLNTTEDMSGCTAEIDGPNCLFWDPYFKSMFGSRIKMVLRDEGGILTIEYPTFHKKLTLDPAKTPEFLGRVYEALKLVTKSFQKNKDLLEGWENV